MRFIGKIGSLALMGFVVGVAARTGVALAEVYSDSFLSRFVKPNHRVENDIINSEDVL